MYDCDNARMSGASRGPYMEYFGVRISPKQLILQNAYDGRCYREKITFQNVSFKPVVIQTGLPTSHSFHMENCLHHCVLSCGLKAELWIRYTYNRNVVMQAQIPVFINDHHMCYDMMVFVSSGSVYSEPRSITFGTINLGNTVHVQTLVLHNKGYKTTKYEFDLADNELGLIVRPNKSYIPARGKINVEINIIGFVEGIYLKQVWIKCIKPFHITISVTVITPKLCLEYPLEATDYFALVHFMPVYGGCTSVQYVEVLNFNTLRSMYICIPEFKGEVIAHELAIKKDPKYECFDIQPVDGFLDPNQKKKITISFKLQHDIHVREEHVYFLFYRVMRLDCVGIESMVHDKPKKLINKEIFRQGSRDQDQLSHDSDGELAEAIDESPSVTVVKPGNLGKYIRLGLHVSVKPVEVEVHPNVVYLQPLIINQSETFLITIRNNSRSLPITFRYKKVANIDTHPTHGYLHCQEMREVLVNFKPEAAGSNFQGVEFDLLYANQPIEENDPLMKVGGVSVAIVVDVSATMVQGKPKINNGITPAITNEVGFLTEDIRFNTKIKKPRQAMLQCKPKNENAVIAFPNDRPKCLRPYTRTDTKCQTIFAALNRIVVTHDEYMLTEKELSYKKQNDKYYLNYIHDLRETRFITKTCRKSRELNDYDISYDKLMEIIPPSEIPEEKKVLLKTKHTFTKLTPIQIYLFDVKPVVIKADKVVIGSHSNYKLSITNNNVFRVKMYVSPHGLGDDSVFMNLPQSFIVEPEQDLQVKIRFSPKCLGKFNAILNICLNDLHFLPVLFVADVVLPGVKLDKHEMLFDDVNPEPFQFFNVYNTLNTNVRYTWHIPTSCCFAVRPLSGTIPPNRFITSEITYNINQSQRTSAKLGVRSEYGTSVHLNVNAFVEKCNITLLMSQIEFPHIPLNTQMKQINTLRNVNTETILYTVKNANPCPGVDITPTGGKLRGRSDLDLTITVYFKALIKFNCKVDIEFQHHPDISFQVTGEVDFPNIVYHPYDLKTSIPKEIAKAANIKRVPAGSLDILPFTIHNKGSSVVRLKFVRELFPEITIATSMEIRHLSHTPSTSEIVLESDEKTLLYLHFLPLDVSMYEFYLPMIINDILGPSAKDNPLSLMANMYLNQFQTYYEDSHIEMLPQNRKIAVFTVSTLSTRHSLRFSRTIFKFNYFPSVHYRSVVSQEVRIHNTSKDITEFCIGIDDLHPHFDLTCKSQTEYKIQNDFMIFAVEAEDELTLVAHFLPTVPGKYETYLPIHIKDLRDASIFNYLQLSGKYPNPKFDCRKWIYLDPVPLKFLLSLDLPVKGSFHTPTCEINLDQNIWQLKSAVISNSFSDDKDQLNWEMTIRLKFYSPVPMSFSTKLVITCTCGGYQEVLVAGCADDCVLSRYMYRCTDVVYTENSKFITFPNFPDEQTSCAEFIAYMNKIVDACERWLYEQVFSSIYYQFIPLSMAGTYRDIRKKTHIQSDSNVLVLVKILHNIVGDKVLPYLKNRDIPWQDKFERINYYHATFCNAIVFLIAQGAVMPHVRPRYMLRYVDYAVYIEKIRNQKQKPPMVVMSQYDHFRRHKQAWLDIIIQIFKCFHLSGVIERNRVENTVGGIEFSENLDVMNPQDFLLLWLDKIFEKNRLELTYLDTKRPKDFVLEPREIKAFSPDLSDGLVLAAVTLNYCPYLAPHLKDLYVCVDSPDKAFHNACQLILAWKLIKCSFSLRPCEISKPISLQMIMFVTYMCDVFPNLVPLENINFNVTLSSKMFKELDVRNVNKTEDLFYTIQFLNNDMDSFSIGSQDKTIKIPAGKTEKIKVFFQAKRVATIKATLIFSGETAERAYSKCIVFSLTGEINFDENPRNVMTITLGLYTHDTRKLKITAPYAVATTYEILYSFEQIEDVSTANILHVKNTFGHVKPRYLRLLESKLKCNDRGIGFHNVEVFCLSPVEINRWLIYSNKELGDFFVRFCLKPAKIPQALITPLYVPVPENWDEIRCECKTNNLMSPEKCPRTIRVRVPCRNDIQWGIITKSMLTSAPENEKMVWSMYLEGEGGAHILQCVIWPEISAFHHLFHPNARYKIVNMNHELELPPNVVIQNIRADDYVELNMHVRDCTPKRTTYDISLRACDGSEFRFYKLILQTPIHDG